MLLFDQENVLPRFTGGEGVKGSQGQDCREAVVVGVCASTYDDTAEGRDRKLRHAAATARYLNSASKLCCFSGRGQRICQGLDVSGVVSTAVNGVEPQWNATIRTPRGVGRLFDSLKLWA
jgi:hypothetical protein